MITVEIEGVEATLKDGKWKCKDRFMKKLLDDFSYDDIVGYSPFQDLTLAQLVVKELDGMIIKITDRPKFVKGRIY